MQPIKDKILYRYIIELEKGEGKLCLYCSYKKKNMSLLPEQKK